MITDRKPIREFPGGIRVYGYSSDDFEYVGMFYKLEVLEESTGITLKEYDSIYSEDELGEAFAFAEGFSKCKERQ